MRPKDKVAVITGAAGGIGREIAVTFAREGARITIGQSIVISHGWFVQ